MKTSFLIGLFFCFIINIDLSAQTIQELNVSEPQVNKECNLNCPDCGKLVFTTSLSNLDFVSQMKYIISKEKDSVTTSDNVRKYIYSIITRAKTEQQLIITGSEIKDYSLSVRDLKAGTCFDYIIRLAIKLNIEGPEKDFTKVGLSNCSECGKLIFTTTLPKLNFTSEAGNIKGEQIDSIVDKQRRYVYKLTILASPDQEIIIGGPGIKNFTLTVNNLKPVECFDYVINPIYPPAIIVPVSSPVSYGTGLLSVNTNPPGAAISINNIPGGLTPYKNVNHPAGEFKIKLEKAGFNTLDTTIVVETKKESELTINLKPSYTPPPPVDQKAVLQTEIKKHSGKQTFWLISTAVAAGTGGYFMLAADKKYKEYQSSDDSHASDLYDTTVLYDKIKTACFGLAGFCAIEFTIQTVKKNKDKNQLNILMSGQGLKLTYNF